MLSTNHTLQRISRDHFVKLNALREELVNYPKDLLDLIFSYYFIFPLLQLQSPVVYRNPNIFPCIIEAFTPHNRPSATIKKAYHLRLTTQKIEIPNLKELLHCLKRIGDDSNYYFKFPDTKNSAHSQEMSFEQHFIQLLKEWPDNVELDFVKEMKTAIALNANETTIDIAQFLYRTQPAEIMLQKSIYQQIKTILVTIPEILPLISQVFLLPDPLKAFYLLICGANFYNRIQIYHATQPLFEESKQDWSFLKKGVMIGLLYVCMPNTKGLPGPDEWQKALNVLPYLFILGGNQYLNFIKTTFYALRQYDHHPRENKWLSRALLLLSGAHLVSESYFYFQRNQFSKNELFIAIPANIAYSLTRVSMFAVASRQSAVHLRDLITQPMNKDFSIQPESKKTAYTRKSLRWMSVLAITVYAFLTTENPLLLLLAGIAWLNELAILDAMKTIRYRFYHQPHQETEMTEALSEEFISNPPEDSEDLSLLVFRRLSA